MSSLRNPPPLRSTGGGGDGMKTNGWRSGCDEVEPGDLSPGSGYDELEVNGVEEGQNDIAMKRQLTTAGRRMHLKFLSNEAGSVLD